MMEDFESNGILDFELISFLKFTKPPNSSSITDRFVLLKEAAYLPSNLQANTFWIKSVRFIWSHSQYKS